MTQKTKEQAQLQPSKQEAGFPLNKINFIMIATCVALIVVGFVLMGGSSNVGSTFNNDIFSTRRIVVAPIVTLVGFLLIIYAIMAKPKSPNKSKDKDSGTTPQNK